MANGAQHGWLPSLFGILDPKAWAEDKAPQALQTLKLTGLIWGQVGARSLHGAVNMNQTKIQYALIAQHTPSAPEATLPTNVHGAPSKPDLTRAIGFQYRG